MSKVFFLLPGIGPPGTCKDYRKDTRLAGVVPPAWYTLAEHPWYTLADDARYILGEHPWYIIARTMTTDATWLMQTVVHELAHIIDWHSHIQTGVTSVYGNPVPTHGRFSDAWHGAPLTDYAAGDEFRPYPRSWERWAVAVTVYVFGAEAVKTSGPLRISGAALAVQMSRMHDLLEGWR